MGRERTYCRHRGDFSGEAHPARMAHIVKVREAMSTTLLEVGEDVTLQVAAKRMADARVNSLVVRPSAKEEPFGIVTSTDIVEAIAGGQDPSKTEVYEVAAA